MERDARVRRGAVLAAGVLLLLGAGVALQYGLRSDSDALRLSDPVVEARDGQLEIDAEVSSPSGTSSFRLWYTLTAGEGEDVQPSYRSATTSGSVSSDEPVRIDISDPVNVVPDEYRLDLWLHERVRDEFVHAQRRVVYVDLSDTTPEFLRTNAPREVEVVSSSVPGESANPMPLNGEVELRNLSDEARTVSFAVGVSDAGEQVVGGESPPTSWAVSVERALPPLTSDTIDVDELVAVAPGPRQIRFQVVEADTVLDDVVQSAAIDVPESSPTVVRPALPDGPLMITEMAAMTEWIDATREVVTVTLRNLSNEPQVGTVEVTLAPPGVEEPWAQSRAACPATTVEVAPRDSAVVPISCVLTSPVDELETLVWVFTGAEVEPGDTPSDAVLAADPTTVVPDPAIEHRAERALGDALITAIAEPAAAVTGQDFTATVTVENPGDAPIEVQVWWILYDLTDEADAPPLAESERVELTLQPGEVVDVEVTGPVSAEPGTYQLSTAVHTRSDGDWIHGDQAWSPVPFRVVEP